MTVIHIIKSSGLIIDGSLLRYLSFYAINGCVGNEPKPDLTSTFFVGYKSLESDGTRYAEGSFKPLRISNKWIDFASDEVKNYLTRIWTK